MNRDARGEEPVVGIGGLVFQLGKIALEAEVVVDVAIVARIVLVHRIGFENRIEIDRVDAELAQVRQRLDEPLNVAAVAALPDHRHDRGNPQCI